MPVFTAETTRVRPGKRSSASAAPAGTPSASEISVASPETWSDSHRIAKTSESPVRRSRSASRTPATSRSTLEVLLLSARDAHEQRLAEAGARGGDLRQRVGRALLAADPRRIALGPDHDEVVDHDQAALRELALLDVFPLERRRVDEDDVGFAARGESQRLAGADGHRLQGEAGL